LPPEDVGLRGQLAACRELDHSGAVRPVKIGPSDERIEASMWRDDGRFVEIKEVVAWLFGLGLGCNALLFVPQAIALWRKKTDEGISLITFGGFSALQVISIVHGVLEHDRALTLGMGASLITCGTVTLLTVVYRIRRLRSARRLVRGSSG
jgi:MtN3 and saliva related transmembrane protein